MWCAEDLNYFRLCVDSSVALTYMMSRFDRRMTKSWNGTLLKQWAYDICVFRTKAATDSDVMTATCSGIMAATYSDGMTAT